MRTPLILRSAGNLDFLFVLPWFAGEQGGTSFPVMPGVGVEFPYSIAVLMAYLEKQGISTALLDLGLECDPQRMLRTVLIQRRPRIVGISCFSANISCAEVVAQTVKEMTPNTPVVLGGFHASAMPEACLSDYDCFDFVMHGEVELTLPSFVQDLLNGRVDAATPNLALRTETGIRVNPQGPIIEQLDDLPFPALDKVDFRRYRPLPSNFAQLPTFGLMSSRGCPFKCTFCATHFQWNKTLRKMSAGHAVDLVEKMTVDYGTRDFRFYDDIFTIPPHVCTEFCEEVLRRKLRITWNCYSRVDTITEKLAKLMKRAGCYHMKFGIEAGTQGSLIRIQKHIEIERAVEAVRMVKRLGIEVKSSFILGIAGESLDESRQTAEFARRLA
ncbi:MAG: radical SAM protein, partial [Phycisphaerales bacterium]|nr:radical SAM protein [Phycisphaerales bacterium]